MENWFQGMEYVYEVYKEKSFSKAAKNLFISQPSLSANVKRIEKKIGYPIFDRSTSPIRLTECGEKYIKATNEMLAIEESFYNYVTDLGGLKTGHLRIGGSSLFSSYVFPSLISKFTSLYPAVKIDVTEENTPNLETLLGEGVLDLVMDNTKFDEKVFGKVPFRKEHLILAAPVSLTESQAVFPYALSHEQICQGTFLKEEIKPLPLNLLKEESFVMLKPENDTRMRGLRICREYGFTPKIILELDQQATAYNVTSQGMGPTFISDTLIQNVPPHPNVVFFKLSGKEVDRVLYFYKKKGKYTTKAMEEFLHLASSY